ncbi:MAG: sigma-70 family RNA polymerase sigma factor [Betaproteobacteria bacterium]|nr:sigma-70 family RNA polymerase sigma factor [Betaproteobacteria bacterium]
MTNITALIEQANEGSQPALDGLFRELYQDLKRLARSRMSRSEPITLLDPTSLINEAYLHFVSAKRLDLKDRRHFLTYAAKVMRNVVVDFIRVRRAERRGGDQIHVTLNTDLGLAAHDKDDEALGVHEALLELAEADPRMVKVVELRYFAGLTESEVADALGIADRTARRDWEKARLMLAAMLRAP